MARSKDRPSPAQKDAKNINFVAAGHMKSVPQGETRRSLQPSDLAYITNPIEHTFAKSVMEAGLLIYPGPRISAPHAVENDHGKTIKQITDPDYEVVRQRRKTSFKAIVEVTKSNHMTPQKRSQLRVVEAAGITNYFQIRGKTVQELPHLHPTVRRHALIDMLKLKKTNKNSTV